MTITFFLLFIIKWQIIDIYSLFQQVVMLSSFDKMDDVWEIHSNVISWMLLYFIHKDKHSSFINLSQSFNDQLGSVIGIVFTEGVLHQFNSQILWWFIHANLMYNSMLSFISCQSSSSTNSVASLKLWQNSEPNNDHLHSLYVDEIESQSRFFGTFRFFPLDSFINKANLC